MHRLAVLFVLSLTIFASAATDVTIQVGVGNGNLSFSPNWVVVEPGDVVTWSWVLGHHTVVQGPSQGACAKLVGGFYSPSQTSGTFSWTVTGTGPWYYFCAVPGHCVRGMWGVLAVAGMTDTIPSTTALTNSSIVASSSSYSSSSSSNATSTIPLTVSPSSAANSPSSTPSPTASTSAAAFIQINWVLAMLALFGWVALLV